VIVGGKPEDGWHENGGKLLLLAGSDHFGGELLVDDTGEFPHEKKRFFRQIVLVGFHEGI